MKVRHMKKEEIAKKINQIIVQYQSSSEFIPSVAYSDGGTENPSARLNRAAINQIEGEEGATLSRYAIWANTIRDNIIEATKLMNDNPKKSIELLKISANSLSAFSDIQEIFDPFKRENI